jgi:hypothetical protein
MHIRNDACRPLAIVVFAACVALPGSAFGQTYWVSAHGQSAWTGCTGDAPRNGTAACSIGTANTNAAAGDTVYLRGGLYSSDIFIDPVNSGEAGRPIVFTAYSGERVLVNNQRLANGNHEASAWLGLNGVVSVHSLERAWDGRYSTKFTARAAGQGAVSTSFYLEPRKSGLGYWCTVRVYTDQAAVNLQVRKADASEVVLNKTSSATPNQWTVIGGYFVPSSSGDYVVAVTATAPSGTFYVDGTRVNAYQASIHIAGNDHILVSGVDVQSVWRGFEIRNGAHYNEIAHSSFTDMNVYSANIIWDAGGSPSTYNWVHHSVFHDSGYVTRGGVGECDDIQTLLRVGNTTSTDKSSYNLLENNTFFHGGHDLVIISTKFNTFRDNTLHNEGWIQNLDGPCRDVDGDPNTTNNPSKFGNRGLLFENPGNNGGSSLVEGNRVGFSGTPPDDDGSSGIENPSDGNIVRYNFLFKNGGSGYYFKAQPGVSGSDVLPEDNRVYNNTFFANGGGTDISVGLQTGVYFVCGSVYTPTNPRIANVIKNNIVFGNVRAVGRADCAGYNYVNNFEQDPQFENPNVVDPLSSATLPDLRLRAGSPAIDGAAPLTTVRSGDTGTGTTLTVVDARFFQDGTWGPPGKIHPDIIAVGHPTNAVPVARVNYETNAIELATSISRRTGDRVWLYAKSDGRVVLKGAGPDFGASEFGAGTSPTAPTNVHIIR